MSEHPPPSIADALFREGATAFAQGDLNAADRLFRQCLQAAPGHPQVLHNLGVVAHRQNRLKDAEALLLDAAGKNAGLQTWLLLAQIYEAGGRDAEAAPWLEKIIAAQPANASALLALGNISDRMGDKPAARDLYRRAVESDPGNVAAGQKYSNALWDKDPEESVAVATRLLAAVRGNIKARAQVLSSLMSQVEWLGRIREGLSPDHAEHLGELFFRHGRDRLAEFEEVNEQMRAAGDTRALTGLALARICRGDRAGADDLLQKAAKQTAGTIFENIRLSRVFHDALRDVADADLTGALPDCIDVTPLTPDPGGVLYLACDVNYLAAFALPLLCSIAAKSPQTPVHLHIFELPKVLAPILVAFCKRLSPLRFAISAESPGLSGGPLMKARGYYHAVRFIRFHAHLRRYGCPLWMTDVDTLVNRDLSGLFSMLGAADIAMRVRPGRIEPWNQFNASLIAAAPTPRALDYHRRAAAYIAAFHRQDALHWGIDQLAMFAVFTAMQDEGTAPDVALLGRAAVNYDYNDDGYIWNNSGVRKFQHLRRIADPQAVPAANFEGNRFVTAFERYWQTARKTAAKVGWQI